MSRAKGRVVSPRARGLSSGPKVQPKRRDVASAFLVSMCEKRGGLITPEQVVEAARDPKSPIHDRFTWDDTEAARKYRLEEARALIRVSVTVVENIAGPIRAFCSLPTDRLSGQGYRLTAAVMSDADQRAQMLACALEELRAFQQRYQELQELAEVFAALAKVRA